MGDTQAWGQTTDLALASYYAAACIDGGFAYVLGGANGVGTFTTNTQFAPVNADGSLGAWQATTPLPHWHSNATAFVYQGHVFFLGASGSNVGPGFYSAPINPDGSLGAWTTLATPANGQAYTKQKGMALLNGRAYVAAWEASSGAAGVQVSMTALNADGSIGGWANTLNLPVGASEALAFVAKNTLYVLTLDGPIYKATLAGDGTVTAWTALATAAPAWTTFPVVLAVAPDGTVFVGPTGSGLASSLSWTTVNGDGSLGAWADSASFLADPALNLVQFALAAGPNALNVFGGKNTVDLSGPFTATYYAKFAAASVRRGVPTNFVTNVLWKRRPVGDHE